MTNTTHDTLTSPMKTLQELREARSKAYAEMVVATWRAIDARQQFGKASLEYDQASKLLAGLKTAYLLTLEAFRAKQDQDVGSAI